MLFLNIILKCNTKIIYPNEIDYAIKITYYIKPKLRVRPDLNQHLLS